MITSIAQNTANEMVQIEEPVSRVTDVEPEILRPSGDDISGCYLDRPG